MPLQLRRLFSDASSTDEARSWSMEDCVTPPCTSPRKRRRLIIQGVASEEDFAHGQLRVSADGVPLWSKQDVISKTPSRAVGVSETAERIGRLRVCALARAIIRRLLGSGSSSASLDEVRLQAQVAACYRVQVFFTVNSLTMEDPDAAAAAAALVAIKAVGAPYRVDDVLKAAEACFQDGEAAQGGLAQGLESEHVLKVEARMLQEPGANLGGKRQAELLLGPIGSFSARLMACLPRSEAFQTSCRSSPPEEVADTLKPQLVQVARNFLADSMQGLGALMAEPHTVAAGAVVLAARFVLRRNGNEVCSEELFSLLCDCSDPVVADAGNSPRTLVRAEVKRAAGEALQVFHHWEEVRRSSAEATPLR